MKISGHDIGVCSWSLHPRDMAHLVQMLQQLGISHVQIAMLNLIQLDDKRKHQELGHLRSAGITVTAGMIHFPGEDYSTINAIQRTGGFVPDDLWAVRRGLAKESARLAQEMGIGIVSTHVGYIPPSTAPSYKVLRDRVRDVAQDFAAFGIDLLMETGPEPADDLLHFMQDLKAPNLHINFDPANMILYGAWDPIAALRALGKHVRHAHAKDATASAKPGVEWGKEVPFGRGEVDVPAFLAGLRTAGYAGPLAIEREAGDDRMGDVRIAIDTLRAPSRAT